MRGPAFAEITPGQGRREPQDEPPDVEMYGSYTRHAYGSATNREE